MRSRSAAGWLAGPTALRVPGRLLALRLGRALVLFGLQLRARTAIRRCDMELSDRLDEQRHGARPELNLG